MNNRAEHKQAARDKDAQRVASGEATFRQLRKENHLLGRVDLSSFRIVSIGKRLLKDAPQ